MLLIIAFRCEQPELCSEKLGRKRRAGQTRDWTRCVTGCDRQRARVQRLMLTLDKVLCRCMLCHGQAKKNSTKKNRTKSQKQGCMHTGAYRHMRHRVSRCSQLVHKQPKFTLTLDILLEKYLQVLILDSFLTDPAVVNWEFKGEGKLTHNRTWAFLSKLNMYKKGVKCCYATSEDTATTCPAAHSAHMGCSFITALLTNTYNWSAVFKKSGKSSLPREKKQNTPTTEVPQQWSYAKFLSSKTMNKLFPLRSWKLFLVLLCNSILPGTLKGRFSIWNMQNTVYTPGKWRIKQELIEITNREFAFRFSN